MLEEAGFVVIPGAEVGFSDSISVPEPVTDPDVIVVDATDDEGRSDRLELAGYPGLPAVILGGRPPESSRRSNIGPSMAWLRRECGPDEIAAAVRAVAAGLDVFDRALGDRGTLQAWETGQRRGDDTAIPFEPLTPRESEVLRALARGSTNKAIAYDLGISEHTVKYHVGSILTKLDASGRTQAVTVAARLGLLAL